jgi:predicted DNA-binding transcriptional regulator YafY
MLVRAIIPLPGYGEGVRADRLVSLALLLQARGRMSARDLAAELEVSVRTVYRDISALNAAGIPVMAEAGRGGGCRLVEGYRFPLRGLSAAEAEALLILGIPAAVAELGLADAVSAAHRKVSATASATPNGGAIGESQLVHLDMPRWFRAAEPAPHLRTLAEAVRAGRQVRLGYRRDGSAAAAEHVVGPLGLVNKAGTWYVVPPAAPRTPDDTPADGRSHEPLVYRAGRITSAQLLTDPVGRPAGFDLVAFWERWSAEFVSSRPTVEVRARLSRSALAALPYVFGDTGKDVARAAGPPDADGFREVTFAFEDERAATQRLAGFGGEVEVLSPPAVRDRLVATARQLLARYALKQDAG